MTEDERDGAVTKMHMSTRSGRIDKDKKASEMYMEIASILNEDPELADKAFEDQVADARSHLPKEGTDTTTFSGDDWKSLQRLNVLLRFAGSKARKRLEQKAQSGEGKAESQEL